MFKIPTVAHSTIIFTYTKDSMPIEEVYGLPEDAEFTPDVTHRLMERIMPEYQNYPSKEMIDEWFVDNQTMPIFGACPPLAEGVLVERLAQEIMDLPGRVPLPVQPGYAIFDTLTWTAKLVDKAWWAE